MIFSDKQPDESIQNDLDGFGKIENVQNHTQHDAGNEEIVELEESIKDGTYGSILHDKDDVVESITPHNSSIVSSEIPRETEFSPTRSTSADAGNFFVLVKRARK